MESREQSSRVCSGAHAEKPLRAEPRAGEKVQRPPQVQIVLAMRRAGDCAAGKSIVSFLEPWAAPCSEHECTADDGRARDPSAQRVRARRELRSEPLAAAQRAPDLL